MTTMPTITGSLAAFRGTFPGNSRSIENPNEPLYDPKNWLAEAFGAEESAAGVSVNSETALRYAPWWRGINLLSSDVGKLPLFVYRRVGAGKERDSSHQAYRLLRYTANDELMSAFTFKQTLTSHALSHGNGYAWIMRSGDARPQELIVLDPRQVMPLRENGRLWYAVRVGFEWRRVNPTEIFHIKGLSPDGLTGYSVYHKAKESIGEGMAAQEYGSRFFSNGARPSVVIEVPNGMGDDAQRSFLKQWERMHTGLESSHRTAILTNGAKVNAFSVNARDSQMHEIRKFNLVDIANWIGIPVHKVGGEGRTAYSSLEQENQAYLDESLDPWLVRWEDECREKLLTEEQKDNDTHTVEFLRQALVRADIVARYTAHNIAVRGGWESRDEVRSSENKAPLPDGQGSKFFAPLELQIVGEDQPKEVDDLPALLSITDAVVAGTLPPDSAKAMIGAAFPLLSPEQINQIVDPLEEAEPAEDRMEPPATGSVDTAEAEDPENDPEDIAEPTYDPQPDTMGIARRLVIEAARRACNHLQTHAVKRAKRTKEFPGDLNIDRPQDEERVSEILDAPVSLCQVMGSEHNPDYVSRFIVGEMKIELLAAVDVADVEARMSEFASTLPERVADLLLPKGSTDGTPLSAE